MTGLLPGILSFLPSQIIQPHFSITLSNQVICDLNSASDLLFETDITFMVDWAFKKQSFAVHACFQLLGFLP